MIAGRLSDGPLGIVSMLTGNGAIQLLNPFVSQGELRRPLQHRPARSPAITIVNRLYARRGFPRYGGKVILQNASSINLGTRRRDEAAPAVDCMIKMALKRRH
jgi:hypothetical protein